MRTDFLADRVCKGRDICRCAALVRPQWTDPARAAEVALFWPPRGRASRAGKASRCTEREAGLDSTIGNSVPIRAGSPGRRQGAATVTFVAEQVMVSALRATAAAQVPLGRGIWSGNTVLGGSDGSCAPSSVLWSNVVTHE